MLRVIHVSDLHLGIRFKQLIGDDVHKFVNEHILDNVLMSVEYALEVGADIYLLTGDIFNKIRHSLEYSHLLVEIFKRLVDSGVYIVLVAGNHDIPRISGVHNALYLVNRLGLDRFVFVEHPVDKPIVFKAEGGKVGLVPLPYVHATGDPREKIEKYILSLYEGVRDLDYRILAAHMDVLGARYSELDILIRSFYMLPYRLPPETFHPELFDYIALGHIHLHQSIRGYSNMWYPGSIDRVNFGEVGQSKGFMCVDIDEDVKSNFIETEPINMHVIKGLFFRGGFKVSEFVSEIEEYNGLTDSLIKIEAVFDRDSWDGFRGSLDRIKEYLLVNRGVRGFIVIPSFLHVSPDTKIEGYVSLERGWIEGRLREYIKFLKELSKEDRELMLEYALRLLRDALGE